MKQLLEVFTLVLLCMQFVKSADCDTCTRSQRRCVFMHGRDLNTTSKPTESFQSYFGDIEKHAPCCSSFEFLHLDTMNYAWHDEPLLEDICNALSTVTIKDKEFKKEHHLVIKDTIFIGHEFANLALARALDTGVCEFDLQSSDWVSLAAPMAGTVAVDTKINLCRSKSIVKRAFADSKKYCKMSRAEYSLRSQYGKIWNDKADTRYRTQQKRDHFELDEMYHTAQQAYSRFVSAALCGISSSKTRVYNFSGLNDGYVDLSSCRKGVGHQFYDSYRHKFYAAKVSHKDSSFRNGDARSDFKKPVQWFKCLDYTKAADVEGKTDFNASVRKTGSRHTLPWRSAKVSSAVRTNELETIKTED